MNLKKIPRGEMGGIPTIIKFKEVMIELFKGYPAFEYFGIFESYFGNDLGGKIVEILKKDKLIELGPEITDKPPRYRLTGEGINMAISMINLDYSEKMNKFTKWIISLTIITVIMGLIQIYPIIIQFLQSQ